MNTMLPMTRVLDALTHFDHAPSRRCTVDHTWHGTPRADILEGDKDFRIMLDMPGVKAEKLEINVENQTLQVKAETENLVPEGFERRRHERPAHAEFSRSFNLGAHVDQEKISAKLEDGVLMITLPKSETSLPRRIEVE